MFLRQDRLIRHGPTGGLDQEPFYRHFDLRFDLPYRQMQPEKPADRFERGVMPGTVFGLPCEKLAHRDIEIIPPALRKPLVEPFLARIEPGWRPTAAKYRIGIIWKRRGFHWLKEISRVRGFRSTIGYAWLIRCRITVFLLTYLTMILLFKI